LNFDVDQQPTHFELANTLLFLSFQIVQVVANQIACKHNKMSLQNT
jgi:hypothetical protein